MMLKVSKRRKRKGRCECKVSGVMTSYALRYDIRMQRCTSCLTLLRTLRTRKFSKYTTLCGERHVNLKAVKSSLQSLSYYRTSYLRTYTLLCIRVFRISGLKAYSQCTLPTPELDFIAAIFPNQSTITDTTQPSVLPIPSHSLRTSTRIYCGGGAKFCVSSLRCTAPKRVLPWSKIYSIIHPSASPPPTNTRLVSPPPV